MNNCLRACGSFKYSIQFSVSVLSLYRERDGILRSHSTCLFPVKCALDNT